jgi:hypothetical protein
MTFGKNTFLFFTTPEDTYYKNVKDVQVYEVGDTNMHSGAD